MQFKTYFDSPVGKLLISSDGEYLTGLWIEKQKYYAKGLAQDAQRRDENYQNQYNDRNYRNSFSQL